MVDSAFPHLDISEDIRALMAFVSTCRDEKCLVPQKHPFYPVPEQPPFFHGKRPCLPVVPTKLATNKVMIIGEYPNTRFGTVENQSTGHLETFVPMSDINEPFEGGRYYDGHSIRDYPTFTSLQRNYFDPLGLDMNSDMWLTNINKCHLLRPGHVATYKRIGWNDPPTQASYDADDDYFEIASVCALRHLPRELVLCQPKLIIALGLKAYRVLHSSDDFQIPAPNITFTDVAGKILLANDTTHPLDRRNVFFEKYNVVHLFHPSFFIRSDDQEGLNLHLNEHIPAVRSFMQSIHLL